MQSTAPVSASQPLLFQNVLQSLYTHNPFYLLSAGLILYGLHLSFRPEAGQLINPWALMAALCGYTVLLAATAYLIVRMGKVWDDARSLVLVLILMFLAVSVSFDEIVNTSSAQGYMLLLFGLVFSIAISESLMRGLSLRLPVQYRGPFYAIMTLFFIYPLLVSPEMTGLPPAAVDLRIYGFSVAAGCAFLLLIPAVRWGAACARNESCPWRWPWYPWTAFGFLALGVCLRSYGLSLSFSPARGMESTFGVYYLAPFLLAVVALLLEVGLVEKIRALQNAAAGLAPGVLLLSIPVDGGSAPYRDFLEILLTTIGSPVFTTLLGLVVFYAYAWWRGTRIGEWGFVGALAVACVIGRRTINVATLTPGEWWPLAVLGATQLWIGLSRRNSARSFAGALAVIAAASLALRDTKFVAHSGVAPVHLALLAALSIGFAFRDRFAHILRKIGAFALTCLGLVAAFLPQASEVPAALRLAYLALLTAVAFGCWYRAGDRWYLVVSSINLASLLLATVSSLQRPWSRTVNSRGFQPLVWGIVCFLLAAWISARKGTLARRMHARPALHDRPARGTHPEG
jgi:hypothetical protein